MLDPAVTLRWIEPGQRDCTGRDQVMQLLRKRQSEGPSAHPMHVDYLDERTIVVSPHAPGPHGAAATRITIRHGLVVTMQQYATVRDALLGSAPS